ncbi:MAG: methyltransferase domain-containing protein [candidate division Zixibacteria bacterium]|nr:methyltransferase domain-containing protein [candidate division Zixibacteria bacterium]
MNLREQMEHIYRDVPLENIPWNLSEPPLLLIEAIKTGLIEPCKVVDLGCGAGNYAVWLTQQGFEVTGIDISKEAVGHAEKLAAQAAVSCHFAVCDLLGDVSGYHGSFDLAIDWEVLHHIFPKDRPQYVRNVHSMLCPNGKCLSVCFSENDLSFGGAGKLRDTPLGTTLYFSSEKELRELFGPFFGILDLSTVEIPGKHGPHVANVALLTRK